MTCLPNELAAERAAEGADQRPTSPSPRTWDGRLARWLVTPLVGSAITPNHLTTLRLVIGIAGSICLASGGFRFANAGALLIVLSNFVDHTDGELARIGGTSSRFGHFYDLASDAIVTILLFTCLGIGASATTSSASLPASPTALGLVAGIAIATIFFVRMQIEDLGGKDRVVQSFAAGFETEDVLYLLPLVTWFEVAAPFLVVAAIGSALFAVWVLVDFARATRHARRPAGDALESR